MIWVLTQVQSGIAVSVETFATEAAAMQRVEELLIDFNWDNNSLDLFAGEIGTELEQLSIEAQTS